MQTVRSFFYFNVAAQLWVGYCIEYDVETMASSVRDAWPKLATVCDQWLDLCLEAGKNEVRTNEDINSYFHEAKKEPIGTVRLDWGNLLEGYKLVA